MPLPETVESRRYGNVVELKFWKVEDYDGFLDELRANKIYARILNCHTTNARVFLARDVAVDRGRLDWFSSLDFRNCVQVTMEHDGDQWNFLVDMLVITEDGTTYSNEEIFGDDWLPTPEELRERALAVRQANNVRDRNRTSVKDQTSVGFGFDGPAIPEYAVSFSGCSDREYRPCG